MSDPVISGTSLYLQTNNGIVAAVDLPRKRFEWLRTYPLKAQFGKETVGRRITKPVATRGVVVFSPFDGRTLMSVDARTGELITQVGTYDYMDIRPYGSRMLILDKEGKAQVVVPDTLEVEDTLPGTGYQVVAELNGGLVLQQDQTLEVWSDRKGLQSREGRKCYSVQRPLPAQFHPESVQRPDPLECGPPVSTHRSGPDAQSWCGIPRTQRTLPPTGSHQRGLAGRTAGTSRITTPDIIP